MVHGRAAGGAFEHSYRRGKTGVQLRPSYSPVDQSAVRVAVGVLYALTSRSPLSPYPKPLSDRHGSWWSGLPSSRS